MRLRRWCDGEVAQVAPQVPAAGTARDVDGAWQRLISVQLRTERAWRDVQTHKLLRQRRFRQIQLLQRRAACKVALQAVASDRGARQA